MLQKPSDHRREKIKNSAQALGMPSEVKVTSSNRGAVRSWLNGLGVPAHLYDCATLEELELSYSTCGAGYTGLRRFVEKEIGELDQNAVQFWTRRAAQRAWDNMPYYHDDMHDPAIVLSLDGIPDYGTPDQDDTPDPYPQTPPNPFAENEKKEGATPMTTPDPVTDPFTDKAQEEAAAVHLIKALEALQAMGGDGKAGGTDEKRVIELIKEYSISTKIEIKHNGEEREIPEVSHKQLPDILKAVSCGCNVMMVGPAGSGKTTIANQIAKALGVGFFFNGALSSEYKLTGFVDANGKVVRTAFREAYEKGGVYLFDEIDGSMPDALLAFNAALSNGHADFPDGSVDKHKDFYCIAAANTYGRGADRVYVGRSQMDGASLDRFVIIDLDYDEKLEKILAGNDDWTRFVQEARKATMNQKIRHIISPRASIEGAKLLSAGLSRSIVEQATVWKGLDKDTRRKIENAMSEF